MPLSPSSIIWYRLHRWDVNRHTTRYTGLVSVVSQCKNWRLAESQRNGDQRRRMGLKAREKTFTFTLRFKYRPCDVPVWQQSAFIKHVLLTWRALVCASTPMVHVNTLQVSHKSAVHKNTSYVPSLLCRSTRLFTLELVSDNTRGSEDLCVADGITACIAVFQLSKQPAVTHTMFRPS